MDRLDVSVISKPEVWKYKIVSLFVHHRQIVNIGLSKKKVIFEHRNAKLVMLITAKS